MSKKYAISTSMQWFGEELIDYAQRFVIEQNHATIKQQLLVENSYHCQTESSLRDRVNKVCLRARNLDDEALTILASSDSNSKKLIILMSYLNTYPLVSEFLFEWLYAKLETDFCIITQTEFDRYYEHQQLLYPGELTLSDGGYMRFRNQVFHMLVQSELFSKIDNHYEFSKKIASPELLNYFETKRYYGALIF